MSERITRGVAAVVVAAAVQPAFANGFTCFVIQSGHTASHLARHLTGDAAHRHAPWFQILDPAAARFISKANYDTILPGWHVCIAEGRIRSGRVPPQAASTGAAPHAQPPSAAGVGQLARGGLVGVVCALLVLSAGLLAWRIATDYSIERRALVSIMTLFGERFIGEFERPLRLPGCHDQALESRLRFVPQQRRLDILLAPREGRTYPNLSDHRKNVEYDVGRVLQLLKDERFVGERLSVQGRWVIVVCRLRADLQTGR